MNTNYTVPYAFCEAKYVPSSYMHHSPETCSRPTQNNLAARVHPLPTLQQTGAARNFTTRSQSQLKGWQRSVSRNQQASKHTKHAQVHVRGRIEAPGGHEHDATSASSVPAAAASENPGIR